MGYLIRMAPEVGVWLANVRDRDPAAADLIDEAVAALRAGGESVGPPLVVPVDDPPLNARPDLDAAYGRQLERLTRVRRAVADAATSRKRLELEAGRLEQHLVKVDEQIRNALETGRGGLAEQAGERRRAAEERLAEMRRLHTGMQAEEERLTMASFRLQDKFPPSGPALRPSRPPRRRRKQRPRPRGRRRSSTTPALMPKARVLPQAALATPLRPVQLHPRWSSANCGRAYLGRLVPASCSPSSPRAPPCFSPRVWKVTGCAPGTPKPSRIVASDTGASRGPHADAGFRAYLAVWKPQRRRCTG